MLYIYGYPLTYGKPLTYRNNFVTKSYNVELELKAEWKTLYRRPN